MNHTKKADAHYILKLNKQRIIQLIRENQPISRAELVKLTGLSAPTVSRVVKTLIEEALVKEIGAGESSGGRRPTMLTFHGEENYLIGIEVPASGNIRGILSNFNGAILSEKEIKRDDNPRFDIIVEKLIKIISYLTDSANIPINDISGIGLGISGLIDINQQVVEFSSEFHWNNADVKSAICEHFNVPIKIDDDSRVMALGEMLYGAGRESNNFIFLNLGYGIGTGLVLNSELYYGSHGSAGEFGHFPVNKSSKIQCECGNLGCLEAHASGRAILNRVLELLEAGNESLLEDLSKKDNSNIDLEMIFHALQQNDRLVSNIVNEALEYLGAAVAGLINLLQPRILVLGGDLIDFSDGYVTRELKKLVLQRTLYDTGEDIAIVESKFGRDATTIGSISLILEEILKFNDGYL